MTTCAECDGFGWVYISGQGVRPCACKKARIIRSKMAAIPERFRESSFANFNCSDLALSNAKIVATSIDSVCFIGGYGRGKTHLLTAQYRVKAERLQPCQFWTSGDLMAELQRMETDRDYHSLLRDAVKHSERFHLYWDDIDKFKPSEFRNNAVFDLIDTVYRRGLGLSMTSNMDFDGLQDRFLPAVIRRFDDICKVVRL